MANSSSPSIRPSKIWWLVGIMTFMICILVQMPAVWLVNKFLPDSSYIQQVSGNIWKGSAAVQIPSISASNTPKPLSGTLTWKWKPLSVFLGKLSADIQLVSGQTQLKGDIGKSLNTWQVTDLSGKIDKQTLASIVDWQLPDAPIQVNGLSMTLHEENGFDDVDGQLTWVGGELGYPSGGKVMMITLPAIRADISQESRNGSNVVHANLVDKNSKRLGDMYLDNDGMLDVSLTQRLLENMPDYNGSAPADTAVVSVRQPLIQGMASGTDDIDNNANNNPNSNINGNEGDTSNGE